MIRALRTSVFVGACLCPLVGLMLTGRGWGQAPKQSADDLVGFLTYQSGGRTRPIVVATSCGQTAEDREDREAEKTLISLGPLAVPSLEAALDSIEALGSQSAFAYNSAWLTNAYAHIRGPRAYPRLSRMLPNPKLTGFEGNFDSALAVALGLTSYVSDFGGTATVFGERVTRRPPCLGPEPRDALDDLILAWENDDVGWLEKRLGPSSKASLKSMIEGKTWEGLRAELWPGGPHGGVAMGYQFEVAGSWSQPRDRPEGKSVGVADSGPFHANPEIDTLFKNSVGNDCGRHRIRFLTTQDFFNLYLIDDADLGSLLRLISSCAAAPDQAK